MSKVDIKLLKKVNKIFEKVCADYKNSTHESLVKCFRVNNREILMISITFIIKHKEWLPKERN